MAENNEEKEKTIKQLREELDVNKKIAQLRKNILEKDREHLTESERLAEIRETEMTYLQEQVDFYEKLLTKAEEMAGQEKSYSEIKEKVLDFDEEIIQMAELEIEREEELQELNNKDKSSMDADTLERKKDIEEALNEAHDERNDLEQEYIDLYKQANEAEDIEELLDILRDYRDSWSKANEVRQRGQDIAEESIETYLGVSDAWKESSMGSIVYAQSIGKLEEQVEGYVEKTKEMLTEQNIAMSSLQRMGQISFATSLNIDQARASLVQATAATDTYQEGMEEAYWTTFHYGVSADDVAQAAIAIQSNFARVNDVTEQSTESLIQHVATMERLGVSTAESTKQLDFLVKGFGMTEEEAMKTQKRIAMFSRELNMGTQLVGEYTDALSTIAVYGERSLEVFEGLANQSQQTGLRVGELIDVTKQFDTFEGAAEAAGRLNSVLGGNYLNSVDLMLQTEEERIETMRELTDETGRSWQAMERYQKKAIASAAGIQDMAKAERLFGENSAEARQQMQENRLAQEQYQDALMEGQDALAKLKTLGVTLAISFEPLFNIFNLVAEQLIWLDKIVRDFANFIYDGAGKYVSLFSFALLFLGRSAIMTVISSLGSLMGLLPSFGSLLGETMKEGADDAGGALSKLSDGVKKAASKLKTSVPVILAVGAAIMMMGTGMYMAATGVGNLAKSMEELSGSQMWGLIGVVTVLTAGFVGLAFAVGALGTASAVAAIPILAVGAAVLMMGSAVWIAAKGMQALVESISIQKFIAMAAAMATLAAAMTGMAFMAIVGPIVAGALASITSQINNLNVKKMQGLADFMASLNDIVQADEAVSSVNKIATAIGTLINKIKSIPTNKVVKFGTAYKDIMEPTSKLKTQHIKVIKGVSEGVEQVGNAMTKANAEMDSESIQSLLKEIRKLGGQGGDGGSSGPEKLEVVLTLDGRELDRKIISTVDDQLDVARN